MITNVVGVVAIVKVFFPWLRHIERSTEMKKKIIFFVIMKA